MSDSNQARDVNVPEATTKPNSNFWETVDQLEVIQRLCQCLATRWGISVHFLDTTGNLQNTAPGKLFTPSNQVCQSITATEKGYKDRRESAFALTTNTSATVSKSLTACKTGTSIFALPVAVNGKFVGMVYADGFLMRDSAFEQKIKTQEYLKELGINDVQTRAAVDSLATLDESDLLLVEQILQTMIACVFIEKYGTDYKEQIAKEDHAAGKQKRNDRKDFIGSGPRINDLFATLEKIKGTESPILITGENGTGKEMIAHKIHKESKRRKGKFVAVNCGAFNENLLESELFGHVRGAFTGADRDKKGLFEVANNGTLFLDEVGEMNLAMQVKLMRALQEKTFTPVGSVVEKKSNARIIAATNRDLRRMIKEQTFREDLYYRLNVINIALPALRERQEDIPELVQYFLEKHYDKVKKTISPAAIKTLQAYSWPGNVRQLENEVRRALVLSLGEEIQESDLSESILAEASRKATA